MVSTVLPATAQPSIRGERVKVPGGGVKAAALLKRLVSFERVSNLEALELIPKLLKRKVLREPKEVTRAIRALTQRQLYREAIQFAIDACSWGEGDGGKRVEGNAFVLGAAFHACGLIAGSWTMSLQLLKRAQDAAVELDASAEDSAFLALVRGGAPDLALEQPCSGLKARSAAAAHVGKSHAWQMSIALLAKAEWDHTAWEVLMGAAADAQAWEAAVALLDAMRQAPEGASGTAAVLAAVACAGVQRFELVEQLLGNAVNAAHETALTRLVVSASVPGDRRWQWAMRVLDIMDEQQVKVPVSTCNAVISVCAQSRHWQRALSVLESMCHNSREGVRRPKPDPISFNGALSACERAARPELAARLLQRMLSSGVQPELTSYTSLSAAYGRSTGWQLALAIVSSVRRRHMQPDEALLVASSVACGNQGIEKEAELLSLAQPWEQAELLLRHATQQGTQQSAASITSLTSCLDKGFQWARALRSLEVAKQTDLLALKSYGAALSACHRADAPWDVALGLLEDMSSQRVEISTIALQAAAEAFEDAPMQLHQVLTQLRRQCLAGEDTSVLTTASYSLLYHGMLDGRLAALLDRQVLRPCSRQLRRRSSEPSGPSADTVLSAQPFLGAASLDAFATARLLADSSAAAMVRGRLHARRLHHHLGAPSQERSGLAAKSIPAFVAGYLPSLSLTFGRLVGHRSEGSESFLPSVLADHDRSQHAERQALLSLVQTLDPTMNPGGLDPSGAVRLYISAYPCISCTAVFFQFTQLWPGVHLRVAFDEWEETRRWTVHRDEERIADWCQEWCQDW